MELPIPLPSAAEMRAIDQSTITGGTPSLALMERAGAAVTAVVREKFGTELKRGAPVILCGPGNNGGDGLVIARLLGTSVKVVVSGAPKYSDDFLAQFEKVRGVAEISTTRFGAGAFDISEISKSGLNGLLAAAPLVIDALLGTGSSGEPRGSIKDIIESLRSRSKAKVIAVDSPSGIDADTGAVSGAAVQADATVTIELVKRGMLQSPARELCGEIHAVSIDLDTSMPTEFRVLSARQLEPIPNRRVSAHKGNFGHIFVIGGSRDMPGAPVLSGLSAIRAGAGLVSVVHLRSLGYEVKFPELMLHTVSDSSGSLDLAALPQIDSAISSEHTIVLGPGLGQAPETKALIEKLFPLLKAKKCCVVLDADGLNLLGARDFGPEWVLTPHPGEMARLLNLSTAEVNADRYKAAAELAKQTGSVVVLKGAGSIIYFGSKGWVNMTGNPRMATAGSGDVLAGLIAGLMAQGLSPVEAARAGVYLHGVAGDLASEQGVKPIIATDIATSIPVAIAKWNKSR